MRSVVCLFLLASCAAPARPPLEHRREIAPDAESPAPTRAEAAQGEAVESATCAALDTSFLANLAAERELAIASTPALRALELDLDGDGAREAISIHAGPAGLYALSVAGTSVWIHENEAPAAIDLDPSEPGVELALGSRFGRGSVLGFRRTLAGHELAFAGEWIERSGSPGDRVAYIREGDVMHVLASLAGRDVRARFAAQPCAARIELREIDLDPAGAYDEIVVELHDLASESTTYLLLSREPDGVRTFGPWVDAREFEVTAPGELRVWSFDCGLRREEVWSYARGALARTSLRSYGVHDANLCAGVTFLHADLDGDGALEEIAAQRGLVEIAGQRVARTSLPRSPDLWKSRTRGPTRYRVDDVGMRAEIVDLDHTDGRREVLVTYESEEDGPEWVVVFTYDGRTVVESPVMRGAAETPIAGNARLRTQSFGCGQSFEEVWSLSGGRLARQRAQYHGRFRASQCAG